MLFYLWRGKLERFKRVTDRRIRGLWMGPPPKLISAESLLAGDVLFCGKGSNSFLSRVIQEATDGVYTHCGIYIGDNLVVHATKEGGVQEIGLSEFLGRYTYVAATRSPGANAKRSRMIVDFAKQCTESKIVYNVRGAALSPFREFWNIKRHYNLHNRKRFTNVREKVRNVEKNSFFCSEFIMQCYKECDYIGKGESYHRSACWSPAGLAEERIFELVGYMSNSCLGAVHPEDPYLGGNSWVLTEEGQRRLKEKEFDERIEELVAQNMNPNEDAACHQPDR